MLLQSINLDASMSVSEVLERLARYGLWIDPNHQAAKSRIADHANRLGLPFEEIAECLASKHNLFHAAIRRQWNANILWYARPIEFVLEQCASANPVDTLLSALGLHEKDSRPVIDLQTSEEMPNRDGIVLDGGVPVAVNVASGIERKPRMATGTVKWFNDKKGFGFISQDNGDDVFVHHTSIEGEGFRTLAERDKVEFEVVKDQKGYKATKVAKFIARTSKVRRCIEKETSGTGGGSGGGHEMPSASSAPRGAIGATPKFKLGRKLAGSDVTSEIGMVTNSDDSLLPVTEIRAWPRLDAPRYVPAQQPFGVVVGFGENQQAGVTGDKITFPVPADATFVDITVELIADGIDAIARDKGHILTGCPRMQNTVFLSI